MELWLYDYNNKHASKIGFKLKNQLYLIGFNSSDSSKIIGMKLTGSFLGEAEAFLSSRLFSWPIQYKLHPTINRKTSAGRSSISIVLLRFIFRFGNLAPDNSSYYSKINFVYLEYESKLKIFKK